MGQIYYKKLLINLYLVILEIWKDAKFNASVGYSITYDNGLEKSNLHYGRKLLSRLEEITTITTISTEKRHTAGAMCLCKD